MTTTSWMTCSFFVLLNKMMLYHLSHESSIAPEIWDATTGSITRKRRLFFVYLSSIPVAATGCFIGEIPILPFKHIYVFWLALLSDMLYIRHVDIRIWYFSNWTPCNSLLLLPQSFSWEVVVSRIAIVLLLASITFSSSQMIHMLLSRDTKKKEKMRR